MVKKIKYIVPLFIFFLSLNVKAFTLGTPNSYGYFDDNTTVGPENATLVGFWGSNNYYRSPYLLGGVSSSSHIKRIDFNWFNSNLCPDEDISISGYVAGLTSFFNEQSYTFMLWNGGEQLSCSTTIQENGSRLYYRCYGKGGGSLHIYLFQNSYSLVKQYEIGVSRDVDLSCDVSNKAIVQQSITNSQNIINNQNSNTNQIIQDNQQNTQEIIDNQNQNTQDIINSQNETFGNYCYTNLFPTKEFTSTSNARIVGSGFTINGISVSSDKTYTISFDVTQVPNSDYRVALINSSNSSVSQSGNDITNKINSIAKEIRTTGSYSMTITPTQNGYLYLRSVPSGFKFNNIQLLESSQTYPFTPYGEQKCINKLDEQTNAINGLNDTLNDTSQPNTNQDINDMENMVSSDTPISDLITMPLTLINAYINGVNSSCSPVNLGNLYGTDIIFPCINLEQRLGSNLWHIIDVFFSIFMCYNIGMLFITAFDGITSLRDDFEGLYEPRHADTGYKPKHGG